MSKVYNPQHNHKIPGCMSDCPRCILNKAAPVLLDLLQQCVDAIKQASSGTSIRGSLLIEEEQSIDTVVDVIKMVSAMNGVMACPGNHPPGVVCNMCATEKTVTRKAGSTANNCGVYHEAGLKAQERMCSMKVSVTSTDGSEETREVAEGTKLLDVVSEGSTVLLNGTRTERNPELRDGDEIELIAKSGKNASVR